MNNNLRMTMVTKESINLKLKFLKFESSNCKLSSQILFQIQEHKGIFNSQCLFMQYDFTWLSGLLQSSLVQVEFL